MCACITWLQISLISPDITEFFKLLFFQVFHVQVYACKYFLIFSSMLVGNGVGFTFSYDRPYIVIISIFLALAKDDLVHIGS